MIALVIPCFNEEKRINISMWQSIVDKFPNCHWIFVNDGSSDGTSTLLRKLTGENVHQLDLPMNHGKGNAVRAGLNHVITPPPLSPLGQLNFSKIGYLDSDGAFDESDIASILSIAAEKIESEPFYNVIIGARVKLAGRQIERDKTRHYLGRLISTFICLGWEKAPYDTQSGFKIFSFDSFFCEAVNVPFRTSWFFDIELILRLDALNSVKIWEIPLMKWDEIGKSSIKTSQYFNIYRQIITIRSLVKVHSRRGEN